MVIRNSSKPLTSTDIVSDTPGLHIVANLQSSLRKQLTQHAGFRELIETLVQRYHLQNLGEVFYDFPTGGFTAVVCLAESHLSIHTWPEKGFLTFDVFLSNYKNNNRDITRHIYREVCAYFEAQVLEEHFLDR